MNSKVSNTVKTRLRQTLTGKVYSEVTWNAFDKQQQCKGLQISQEPYHKEAGPRNNCAIQVNQMSRWERGRFKHVDRILVRTLQAQLETQKH